MSKLWLVALHELRLNVIKKSFILVLLSLPLFIALSTGLGVLIDASRKDDRPLGYIDQSGLLMHALQAPLEGGEKRVEFTTFPDEASAGQALEVGQIQAFFILPPDYLDTGKVELIYRKEPGTNAMSQLYNFLQLNLLASQSPQIARRAAIGSNLIIRSISGDQEFKDDNPSFTHFVPLFISLAFVGLLVLSSGYLMDAVFKEKQNRTIEVLFTSLTPRQLIWGKVLGVVAIGLTLLAAWTLIGVLAVFIGGKVLDVVWLQNPEMDWRRAGMITAVAIPGYVMALGIMFTAGVMVANPEDSERIGPLLFVAYFLPFYILQPLLEDPNGTAAVVMSMLPFTCLIAMGFRLMFTSVPTWQLAASVAIQTLAAMGALWLATQSFRIGMLRYGKSLSLAEVMRRGRQKMAQEGG